MFIHNIKLPIYYITFQSYSLISWIIPCSFDTIHFHLLHFHISIVFIVVEIYVSVWLDTGTWLIKSELYHTTFLKLLKTNYYNSIFWMINLYNITSASYYGKWLPLDIAHNTKNIATRYNFISHSSFNLAHRKSVHCVHSLSSMAGCWFNEYFFYSSTK